tara:strand:+ start:85 stop:1392 length:1308 start_codon:yes stop_codon:yes gene_type:complete
MALLTKKDIENIEKDIKALETKVKDGESTIADNIKEVSELDEKKENLKKEISEVKEEKNEKIKEEKEAKIALDLATDTKDKAEAAITSAKAKVKEANNDLDSAKTALDEAKQNVEKAEEGVKEAEEVKSKSEEALGKIQDTSSAEYISLQAKISELNIDLLELKEDEKKANEAADLAVNNLTAKEDALKNAEDKVEAALTEDAVAKKELSEAKDKVIDTEEALEHIGNILEAKEAEEKSVIEEFNKKSNDIDKVKAAVSKDVESINDLKSGSIIKNYEAQVKERLSFAREIAPTEGKAKNILFGKVDDKEQNIVESDNKIVKDAILEGLGIGEGGESAGKINNIIGSIKDAAFGAHEAYEMAEKALFSIDTIIDKIKVEASKGNLSMKINGAELTATKALVIIDLGYKVTYERVKKAKGRSALEFTISWGFQDKS